MADEYKASYLSLLLEKADGDHAYQRIGMGYIFLSEEGAESAEKFDLHCLRTPS